MIQKIKNSLKVIKLWIWVKSLESNKKGIWYYTYWIMGGYKNV